MELNERQSALSILMKSYFREKEQLENALRQLNKAIEFNQTQCDHHYTFTGNNHNDDFETCAICGHQRTV